MYFASYIHTLFRIIRITLLSELLLSVYPSKGIHNDAKGIFYAVRCIDNPTQIPASLHFHFRIAFKILFYQATA